MTSDLLIREPSEITSDWLSRALDRRGLELTDVQRIGTGQMSLTFRVSYKGDDGPGTVIVKLASDNDLSRGTGVGMRAYFREIAFYKHLSERIGGPLSRSHFAEYDEEQGWFTLILDEVAGAEQGDQIAGCDPATAAMVMRALARLHAPVFNDLHVGMMDFLNVPNPINQAVLTAVLPGFLERYSDQISEEQAQVCRRYVAVADAHAADARAPLGIVHGDFRLDNLLFSGGECTVVDWQTLQWGPAMLDAAYFLAGSLEIEDRRKHEKELIKLYYDELLKAGVSNFDWEHCWNEYRRQVFYALLMVIAPAMLVERTDRGDEMFMTLFRRVCQQIIDLDSLDLLPAEGAKPAALRPDPADEDPHTPGAEPFWNESWYFDGVSEDGELGVYVRLGQVPNLGHCVYTIAVVPRGRGAVMVLDYNGPLAVMEPGRQTVTSAGHRAVQECVVPLGEYRIQFDGAAERFEDSADILRARPGSPVQLKLDLRWLTDGVPYQWRAATRYEIPCHVEGSVVIDGKETRVSGTGQRDHSHGSRDWWANDWMWSAFHLEDGTRVHAVTLPDMPGYSVGYIQKDGEVTELGRGSTTYEMAGDGLVSSSSLDLGEGDHHIAVEVIPRGYGPLLLTAPDGRVAHFVRAFADFRCADGRNGVGWIEWNLNQKASGR